MKSKQTFEMAVGKHSPNTHFSLWAQSQTRVEFWGILPWQALALALILLQNMIDFCSCLCEIPLRIPESKFAKV